MKELNAKDVVDIFAKWIKPTVELLYVIIPDQDILFMSATFQDWANSVGVRYKASSVYYQHPDGVTEGNSKLSFLCLLLRSWKRVQIGCRQ